ncbi:hypothetical protein EBT25_15475 [bacterium]|nr:hypothetical protein [bacterium]
MERINELNNSKFRFALTRTYITKPNPLVPIGHRSRTIEVTGYDDPIMVVTEQSIDFWKWLDDNIYREVLMRDYCGKEISLGSHRLPESESMT